MSERLKKEMEVEIDGTGISDELQNAGIVDAAIKYLKDFYAVDVRRDDFWVSLKYKWVFDNSKEPDEFCGFWDWRYVVVLRFTPDFFKAHCNKLSPEQELTVSYWADPSWDILKLDYKTQVVLIMDLMEPSIKELQDFPIY